MVVDMFEPQYLALVVFGGFVALSFVVYAFSAFGIQEKSYEQAVAEQRARLEKEQIQQREVKRQKRKPFFEKKKREREKHDSPPGILRQEVAQAIDPYVEEPEQPPPPVPVKEEKVKPEKVKPSPKKPKQAKPPKQQQVVVEETIFEAKPATVQESIPPPKESHSTKSKPPKVVEEQVQKKAAPTVAAAATPAWQEQASPAKTKTKAKTLAGDGDTPALRGKSLISAVKSAPLKDSEIQQLIEILLNRQGGSASADDWVKANQRNDPVSALKKQLQEKEQSLHTEMLLAQSTSQKVKELRHELNHQKEHTSSIETQYKIKIESQAREIEAFHVRIQQSHESHAHENQALQSRIKQLQALLDESKVEVVGQLREENQRLKTEAGHAAQQKEQLMGQELARLQAELQKMQSKLTSNEAQMRQGDEVRRTLETQINQYKQQRSQFDSEQRDGESALSKRLSEVSEELKKAEFRNQSMAHAVEQSSGETEKLKGQISELRRMDGDRTNTLQTIQAKLKESECQCQKLEGKVGAFETQLAEREQQKKMADQELEALRKEKDSLQDMLRAQEKRSEAEGQEAPPSTNGDCTDSGPKEDTILLKEHNVIVADKTKTIEGLEQTLSSSRTEFTELQAVVEQQKQRNNNLREKNRKLMEVVSAAEKSRAENAGQAAKAVKEEIQSAVGVEQANVKNVLERLFPSVSIDSSPDKKDWLSKFEEQASQVLSNQSSTSSQVEEYTLKINTLEAEKDQLSSQCQHYQSVLSDTEGILNKLQSSVEDEQVKWEDKLKQTESSLGQAKVEVNSLHEELTALSSSETQTNTENSRLASELDEAQAMIDTLSQDQKAAAQSYEATSHELEELKTQLHQLKEELEAANQRAEQSSERKEENAETKTKLEASEAEVKRLSAELQAAKALQTQLDESRSQLEAMKIAKQEAQKEVSSLKEQLAAAPGGGEGGAKEAEITKALAEAEGKASAQQKEITALTDNLKKEKTLTQDLGKAAAKLQVMLKKTQYALNLEKETVAKLKMPNGAKDGELPFDETKVDGTGV